MKNKKIITLILASIFIISSLASYCQTWIPSARGGGFAFVENNFGYMGCGSNGTGYLGDFWKYDFSNNTWSQKSNYVAATVGITSFSNGVKGVVCGHGVSSNDFWEYNDTIDTWLQVANFIGTGRYDACSFTIGNKGYISTGIDNINEYNDLWEYDYTTNTWSQKANLSGVIRYGCFAFSIGNNGYVGGGCNGNTNVYADFYEYNPSSNSWAQKASFGGGNRSFGVGFASGGKGYAGLGWDGNNLHNDFWSYDPLTNTWSNFATMSGAARFLPQAFVYNGNAYIGGGISGNLSGGTPLNDFWELTLPVSSGINEINENTNIILSPNPTNKYLNIDCKNEKRISELNIYNLEGRKINNYEVLNNSKIINVTNLVNGVYFIEFKIGEEFLRKSFVKQ